MLKVIKILVAAILLFTNVNGQNFIITDGSTDNTCSGSFYDTGGSKGSGYSNNENITYTLCPSGGQSIHVNFNAFNLENNDTLYVYDGNTATTLLGKYTNDDLVGLELAGSTGNASGCLTFVFTSNASGSGFWDADLSCGNKCDFPVASFTTGLSNPVKLCEGDNINFDGSGSTTPSGSISTYTWYAGKDTINGQNYAYSSATSNGINLELRVTNDVGCTNINKEQVEVWVSTKADFSNLTSVSDICEGNQACLNGDAQGVLYSEEIPTYTGGLLALPDEPGKCFTSELNFNIFEPGQKLSNINDLQGICIDMEHSYIQDLTFTIECPSGTQVILHDQAGGGRHMGTPVDDDNLPNAIGTCGNYCWTPTAVAGQLSQNGAQDQTIPPGDYNSLQNLKNLEGCPLNGKWKFEVCDNLASDNGFICSWAINFDNSIIPQGISFTPQFNNNHPDSTFWTADATINSTSADGNDICATPIVSGSKNYTFNAINDFGCSFDTTVTVTTHAYPSTDLVDTLEVCENSSSIDVNVTASPAALGTYLYNWTPASGIDNASSNNINIDLGAGVNSYILSVEDNASPNCVTNDTVDIVKIPVPTPSFTTDVDTGCVPFAVKFFDTTSPTPFSYTWKYGDGISDSGTDLDTTAHTYTIWGNKDATLIISTAGGCSDSVTKPLFAAPLPVVQFHSETDQTVDFPQFCFQNVTAHGGDSWQWQFGSEGSSTEEHYCFLFSETVTCHVIKLIAQNDHGCIDSLTKEVCVHGETSKIFIPSAFTPNDDTQNDVFTISLVEVETEDFEFSIYDRWGVVQYTTQSQKVAWDGNASNGKSPAGVYVYILNYKDRFGDTQTRRGHITLIR